MPAPMSSSMPPSASSAQPNDAEVRDAAKFLDEILGTPAVGSSTPGSGSMSNSPSLTESMGGSPGSMTPEGGSGDGSGMPPSSDTAPLQPLVGGDPDKAAKLYAASQRKPQLMGKSPAEVADALKANVNLRMSLMADVGADEDAAAMDAMNAGVEAPKDMSGLAAMQKNIDRPY